MPTVRLRRFRAEIASFIGVHEVAVEKSAVVIEAILLESGVAETAIHDFAVNLQPAIGERYILKVYESCGYAGDRPCIVAPYEVAGR